jgi:hypothetical protein
VLIALHKSGQLQREKLDLVNTQYLEITQNNKSKYKGSNTLDQKIVDFGTRDGASAVILKSSKTSKYHHENRRPLPKKDGVFGGQRN